MAVLLIVDDNQKLRELYRLEFEYEGYSVIEAANGGEAIEIARTGKPDCVILDIGMPEKDGLEVIGEISKMNGGIPVVVNTAYPLFKLDFRAHHAATWITKTSNLDPLKKVVEEIIGLKKRPEGSDLQ